MFLILSHIPIPAHGKDKKRTDTSRTSIRDVIIMLKYRHLGASQQTHDFLEDFFMFFFQYGIRYLVVSKKKYLLFV